MRGLAIDLVKPITDKEFRRMVKKANKQFDKAVRYKGRMTVPTWQRYIVY